MTVTHDATLRARATELRNANRAMARNAECDVLRAAQAMLKARQERSGLAEAWELLERAVDYWGRMRRRCSKDDLAAGPPADGGA